MTRVLNGWRRLGVVLVAIWVLAVIGLTIFETVPAAQGFSHGIFVYQAIPAGTAYGDSKVILPDGKIVNVDARDPSSGRMLDAWEIDWRKYPEVPKTTEVHWMKLAVVAFVIPPVVWLALELVVAVAGWVLRGFKK